MEETKQCSYFFCAGKELDDPRILTDVGDVPVQELRDAGVDDDRLMSIISESVKLVMEEVKHNLCNNFWGSICLLSAGKAY